MAGTVTVKKNKISGVEKAEEYEWSFVADAADGSVPATSTEEAVHGFVTLMRSNPGAPAPTADYDITITDEEGVDVLGGEGADRSASASEQVLPKMGNAYGPRRVDGVLTLNIANNLVNSAQGVIIVSVDP